MLPIGIYIIIAIILLWICSGLSKDKEKKKTGQPAVRLYIPHYMKEDEYKCPVCKARFWKDYMVCPNCGTKFTGTREDDGEFMEEMELWDGDD